MSDIHHIATYTEALTCGAPARTGEYKRVTTVINPHEHPNKQGVSHFVKVSKVIQDRDKQYPCELKEETVTYRQTVLKCCDLFYFFGGVNHFSRNQSLKLQPKLV